MLSHPTVDRLREVGLIGMVHALEEQRRQPDSADLGFEDRLAMLVDREVLERDNKRLKARLRFAGLRQLAAPEDVDYRAHRGLDRAMFQRLAQGEWIERQQNLLITGPTGVGKTWLACALGQRACRDNRSVLYQRVPRMLEGLGLARGDGRYARMLKSLVRVQVLILDDWGLTPLTAEQRRDLLEIIDDRHGRTSTIVTSQLPVDNWHAHIGDPTIADAVLDRLVHSAHRLELRGESLRKLRAAKNVKLDEATVSCPHSTRLRTAPPPRLASSESPAGFRRNRWLASIGIAGCFHRNPQAGDPENKCKPLIRWNASTRTLEGVCSVPVGLD